MNNNPHRFSSPSRGSAELVVTVCCIAFTLCSACLALTDTGRVALERITRGDWSLFAEQAVFIAIVLFLIYGNLVYQVARLGAVRRAAAHLPADDNELSAIFGDAAPSVSVLIPSYKEEPDVVLRTLLSAALMDYPFKRVVLLIDDPPAPSSHADRHLLGETRALARRAAGMLAPARSFCDARLAVLQERLAVRFDITEERRHLVEFMRSVAGYLDEFARAFAGTDHAERFFVQAVLAAPAQALRARADELESNLLEAHGLASADALIEQYRRLRSRFNAELETFERKRFGNLSHAPNKAMNINSYLALCGRRLCVDYDAGGRQIIHDARQGERGFTIPQSDYVITLDADSLLLGDYALRLVHFMERDENQRVAIAQTPYSAYPGASSTIERIAGITTDIQHIVHQGSTFYGGTFWVGANAVIRTSALQDIVVTEIEDGKTVLKYIQDRTVIEDTESTVDLLLKGWRLHNYPERLAYSATPPDFGSLVIQRRRWANGGLIILGKLLRYFAQGPKTTSRALQAFVQVHYLTSLAGVSAGIIVLIVYPFEEPMRSLWLPLTALPYFFLYGRDMVQNGYRWSELPKVYALNLLLLPVNAGGVLKSLQQIVTGRTTPFGRTPKISSRTAAPPVYVLATVALILYCYSGAAFDAVAGRWAHAAFALLNGILLTYAYVALLGARAAFEDLSLLQRLEGSPRAPEKIVPLLVQDEPGDAGRTNAASPITLPRVLRHRTRSWGANTSGADSLERHRQRSAP